MAEPSFLEAVQAGAGLQDMAFKRQERMQALRGEEALRQVRERQLAAQAEYLTAQAELNYEKAKGEADTRLREKALGEASNALAMQIMKRDNKTVEEALPEVLATVAVRFPTEAPKMAAAYENAKQGQMVGKATPATQEQERHNKVMEGLAAGKTSPNVVGDEYKRYQTALQSGDQELAGFHKARLDKLSQQSGMTTTTEIDPTTGKVIVTQGRSSGGNGMTVANKTQVQQAIASSLEVLDLGDQLLPLLNEETVGVKAAVKNVVYDRMLAQINPALASKERADALSVATELRAKAVRANRSDGNIGIKERDEILRAFPDINDPINSAENAKNMVAKSQELAATHAIIESIRLRAPIPQAAAMKMTNKRLASLFNAGLLTAAQVLEIGKLSNRQ